MGISAVEQNTTALTESGRTVKAMAEYIEREAAIEAAKHAWAKGIEPSQYIEIIPAADVATVRHGRWVYKHRNRGGFSRKTGMDDMGETHTITVDERYEIDDPYCSECGKLNESVWHNYCPSCGAKMDLEADKDTGGVAE